jgi:hypothetical protein
LLTLAGLASLALILLFILAALRGQSIVAPDGLTLAVAALGAGALTAAIVVILRREDVKRDA